LRLIAAVYPVATTARVIDCRAARRQTCGLMGRRKRGTHPYDYTVGDDRCFVDCGCGGTLRVLHGPSRGMGVPEGVVCEVEVTSAGGTVLEESREGKLGKEHRLHGTVPGDRVTVVVRGGFGTELLNTSRVVQMTGDLDDVVRFGVGPAWPLVEAIDAGRESWEGHAPQAGNWGAGVRLRGARPDRCEDALPRLGIVPTTRDA